MSIRWLIYTLAMFSTILQFVAGALVGRLAYRWFRQFGSLNRDPHDMDLHRRWSCRTRRKGTAWFRSIVCVLVSSQMTGCQETEEAGIEQLGSRPKLELDLAFDMITEENSPRPAVVPNFEDVSDASGLRFQYFSDDQSGALNFPEVFGGGVACFDFDIDGWCDVFLPNGCHLPNADAAPQPNGERDAVEVSHRVFGDSLFRNRGGQFASVAENARIGGLQYSHGCSYGDINADGFEDLVVANLGTCEILLNQGDGTFLPLTVPLLERNKSWWMVPALADLDEDQTIDLLLVPYVDWKPNAPLSKQEKGPGYPGPNEFPGLPMLALQNNGDGSWNDKTSSWGFEKRAKGMAVVVVDLDGDLRPEIYVANDSASNMLFTQGEQLRFDPRLTNASRANGNPNQMRRVSSDLSPWQDVGEVSGTAAGSNGATEASMSATVADFDRNQRPDLLVTNYFGRPNSLYTNRGNLNFRNIAYASRMDAIGRSFLTFGAVAVDYDLDGSWDVIAANGHVLGPNALVYRQTSQMLRNVDGAFVDVSSLAGSFFKRQGLGRSVGTLDFDNDGDTDVVVTFSDSPSCLLKNKTERFHSWISLEVADPQHRSVVGGRLLAYDGDSPLASISITVGGSYLSDSQKKWTFGIPNSLKSVRLEVHWPDGKIDHWPAVTCNQAYRCLPGRIQELKIENEIGWRENVDEARR